MRVSLLAAVGALAVGGMTLAAAAQPGPGRPGRHPDPAMLQKELGLSDQQAGELKKMWSDERKESVRRRADLRIARMELEELLDAPTVDEKAVAAKVKAVTDLQAAELKSRTDRRLAVKRILTPEQQQKMKELRREHARGAREGRAWRRGRPGTRRPAMGPGGPGPGGLPDDDDAMDEPAAPLER